MTEIVIDAPRKEIWNVLMDFDSYPEWNPFIKRISGKAVAGQTLSVFVSPPNAKGISFTPTVIRCEDECVIEWQGKLLIRGIFDGKHLLQLDTLENGKTLFQQSEEFRGVLVPFLGSALTNTELGFRQMNDALKKRCERR